MIFIYLIIVLAAIWGVIGLVFRHLLLSLWHEPVFKMPVLIFESDDWGPGDAAHAQSLRRIVEILARYQDVRGAHPVVTLGIVLAIPDQGRIRIGADKVYAALTIADQRFSEIRAVIHQGADQGIFSIQLHGMEHYWPPALMAAARQSKEVEEWLRSKFPRTESLPAPLQSRWIDTSCLPSKTHSREEIEYAVTGEVSCFFRVFAHLPFVVVPPTFIWTRDVERAWAKCGVRAIVTPGKRFEGRDSEGKIIPSSIGIRNGMRSAEGLIYLVRDDYFEPARGHSAEQALAAFEVKTRCGRPTLLEMHRFNFIDDPVLAERSYEELERVVEGALRRYPDVVFTSTEILAKAMVNGGSELIETRTSARWQAWCSRIRQESRVWRIARLTGLALMIRLLQRATTVKVPALQ